MTNGASFRGLSDDLFVIKRLTEVNSLDINQLFLSKSVPALHKAPSNLTGKCTHCTQYDFITF